MSGCIKFAGVVSIVLACSAHRVLASEPYWIKVKAHTTSAFEVEGDITTNIPQSPEIAVELALVGQRETETFIGTTFISVPVEKGQAHFVIDAKANPAPVHSTPPAGRYDVVATFQNSPAWKSNWKLSGELNIRGNVEGKARIALAGSGTSPNDSRRLQTGRRWVESNIIPGTAWDAGNWQKRFGASELLKYGGDLEPSVIKVHYFPSIDISVLVNVRKNAVLTWRQGKVDR